MRLNKVATTINISKELDKKINEIFSKEISELLKKEEKITLKRADVIRQMLEEGYKVLIIR